MPIPTLPPWVARSTEEEAVSVEPKNDVPDVYELPWMERSSAGEVVPMPREPALVRASVGTLDEFAKRAVKFVNGDDEAVTANMAEGEVVPMPTAPRNVEVADEEVA